MPIYEYRCPDGHLFELFQRMDDAPAEVCEVCGKGPVEKVMHAVPVFFKGSGFYSTDYGRGSKRRDNTDGSAEPSKAKSDDAAPKKKDEKKPAESG
jgi:putative FmdB family regulatory protein